MDRVPETRDQGLLPVTVITGFLGSGKTTLLQRLLRSPRMQRTAVLMNEFGEVGLDHLLLEHVAESVVLLKSGCICCSIRDDLKSALRGLLSRRDRAEVPEFDRVVIETTGLADPAPILYTLVSEPVVRHHFLLATVITTVDAVNADLHLSRNPEGVRQLAAADRVVITKTDLAEHAQVAAVRALCRRINPSAELLDAAEVGSDPDLLLAVRAPEVHSRAAPGPDATLDTQAGQAHFAALQRHGEDVRSLSLVLDDPLDWTAFGVWLSMLLHRYGNDVLRVKGILQVRELQAPVFINAVQHIVHPPQHLESWPTDDHRSRIVFITRGVDRERLQRSLAAFTKVKVSEASYA